jgi:hypothetical protein
LERKLGQVVRREFGNIDECLDTGCISTREHFPTLEHPQTISNIWHPISQQISLDQLPPPPKIDILSKGGSISRCPELIPS